MNADLIVDFPHQLGKNRAVHFAKTAQLRIFNRPNVARHELSYTKSEYDLMKLVVGEDVLAVLREGGLRENLAMNPKRVYASWESSICSHQHALTRSGHVEQTASKRSSQSRQERGVLLQQDSSIGRLLHLPRSFRQGRPY